jgi:hypothetical protein
MTALTQTFNDIIGVRYEIERHPSWLGSISGLQAEKLLRDYKKPYLYILRKGEHECEDQSDYYVTFILPDCSIKHQPFILTETVNGWYYENMTAGGPFTQASIDDVLHLIMHCHKGECSPLVQFNT